MYPFALSLWRTCVPYIVALLVVQLARLGIRIDDATLASALTAGFGTAYYALFRYLEERFGARWGRLLGAARPPSYPPPPTPAAGSATEDAAAAGPTRAALGTASADSPAGPVDYSKLPEGG